MDSYLDSYLSIGAFAKLCSISRKTLIYYDNEGILSPEIRKENGYRYYSFVQLDTISIIQELRGIGMSLKEIKKYFENRSPNACVEMLDRQQKKLEMKILALKKTEIAIKQKKTITQLGIDLKKIGEIYFKEQEEIDIIEMKRENISNENVMKDISDFIKYTQELGVYMGYPISVAVELNEIKTKQYTQIGRIYMKVDKKIEDKYATVRPKGLYACIIHKGRYDQTGISYEKLVEKIKQSNYEMIGPSYENTIIDFFSVKDEEECLTEITIPIK